MIVLQLLVVPVFSPLIIGVIRKIKATLQNRTGASVIQPYRDLWKLFHKNEVRSRSTSAIFLFGPYLIFALSILLPLGIPLIAGVSAVPIFSDFLVIVYMLALSTFLLALLGLDAGSAFGGFGSSREMTITALTEGVLVCSLLTPVVVARSTNLVVVFDFVRHLSLVTQLPLLLAGIAFLTAVLSEAKRFPFDNPATHLELTMIHEAMILEYSGTRLGLLEWASFNKLLMLILLAVQLFFPWNLGTGMAIIGGVVFKVFVVAAAIAILESSIAKYRFFRLPDVLATALIFSIISLLFIT